MQVFCFLLTLFAFVLFELFVAAINGIPDRSSLIEDLPQFVRNMSLDSTGLENTNLFLQETVFPRLPILNLFIGILLIFGTIFCLKRSQENHFLKMCCQVSVELLIRITSIPIVIASSIILCYQEQYVFDIVLVRYLLYCFLMVWHDALSASKDYTKSK